VADRKTWILNASPLIALAKIDALHLPEQLALQVLVPEAVWREILRGPAEDPARRALENGWGSRESVASVPEQILEWGLGAGESAVLALTSKRHDAVAILDDNTARRCAQVLRLPVMGTLGMVLRAKVAGLIPTAADLVRDLQRAGLHLDAGIIRQALAGVDEIW